MGAFKRKTEKRGTLTQVKEKGFKTRVSNYYARQGFSVKQGVSNQYGDFDLIATKEEGVREKKRITLLIECKECENRTIPLREFVKFVRKFVRYYDHHESLYGGEWEGVYAYIGRLHGKIRPYWKSIPDKDWIRLQPFKK